LLHPSLGERVALRLEQCLRDKPDLRALLQGLLDPNPSKRTRASAALKSKFLQGHVSTCCGDLPALQRAGGRIPCVAPGCSAQPWALEALATPDSPT
jgi:hypothetical protein